MLSLDILGILLSVFLLGPKNWRWSLAAAGVALSATLVTLIVWRVELSTYTMGGLFTHVDLNGGKLSTLLVAVSGPGACYIVCRLAAWRPMGETGWLKQILPWSELEHPLAGTFAKFALLAAVFSAIQVFSG